MEVGPRANVHQVLVPKQCQSRSIAGQCRISGNLGTRSEFHLPCEILGYRCVSIDARLEKLGELPPQVRWGWHRRWFLVAWQRRHGASVQIPEYELQVKFAEHRVFERVASGELDETIEPRTSAPGRRCCFSGFSWFTRIREHDGQEVGRVHYLECVFGHIIGKYVSHIIIDGTLFHRQGHQQLPTSERE